MSIQDMEHRDTNYLLYEGLDKDEEKRNGQCVLGKVDRRCPRGEECPTETTRQALCTAGFAATSRRPQVTLGSNSWSFSVSPLPGVKAQIFFLTGEGRMEKDSGQGQAGTAAAEGEEEEEFSGEDPSVAGASGLMDNLKQEDQSTSRSDPENEKQPKEPVPRDMEVAECVQPVSVLVRQRCFHYKFNQWQLQELERFFQQNHYISAELR